ncbi:MAG TPA: zinc ribbon domain-containing protein [Anaerolineales bacterium]
MDLAAILFLIALLLVITLYLVTPLLGNRSPRAPQETQAVSVLLAERERLLNALQELDFDFQLGKVPAEDYPVQRADLLQQGANILKQLDALAPSRPAIRGQEAGSSSEHARLTDDEIESMLASRRKARTSKSAGFCPRCGKPVLTTDQFCPNCGKSLH